MHHCWVYAQTSPELQGYRLTKAIQIVKELQLRSSERNGTTTSLWPENI